MVGVWLAVKSGGVLPSGGAGEGPPVPQLQGNERELVLAYLNKTVHDPVGLEVVECFEPSLVLFADPKTILNPLLVTVGEDAPPVPPASWRPGVIMDVKYRAKNAVGARVLSEAVFLIEEGHVVRHAVLDPSDPRHFALRAARNRLNVVVGAERVGGKVVAALVRGKVTDRGKPLSEGVMLRFYFEADAVVPAPGNFEAYGLRPGRYRVAVSMGFLRGSNTPVFYPGYTPRTSQLACVVNDRQEVQHLDWTSACLQSRV
jgi:hypothetical protein